MKPVRVSAVVYAARLLTKEFEEGAANEAFN
jgi:hypothetical protein